ncbi:c-type cytochrome [Flavobacterium wongokense]|uniref:c-type cytochrome n=1 Tax=Flavobacterium wongokense TaxID=2910674 RepID=UPI001F322994|nr:cytochrome c [Flavobacterium sp. WG47]MCF6131543.1 cytochrome c [Flavobacterium sp. WG47]
MKLIFKFVLVFIVTTTLVSAYILSKNKEQKNLEPKPVYQPFCGTSIGMDQSADAQKGKQIFNANCAACHKLDAVGTGPVLRDISRKYHKQHLNLYDYLHGKRKKLVLKASGKFRGCLCPVFPNLTKEDVASLEAYTK